MTLYPARQCAVRSGICKYRGSVLHTRCNARHGDNGLPHADFPDEIDIDNAGIVVLPTFARWAVARFRVC